MSLVDLIPRRGRPPIPTGPEQAPPIAKQIEEAQRQREAMLAERPERALDAVNGFEGAEARLGEIDAHVAALEKRLDVLIAAHAAAVQADQRMFAAQRAALHATAVAKVKRTLRDRDEAAEKLARSIGDAVENWRSLVDLSAKAQAAGRAINGIWPTASLCTGPDLYRAVAKELRRQGQVFPVAPGATPAFPTDPNAVSAFDRPDKLRPLAEAVRAASEHIVAELTGQAPK